MSRRSPLDALIVSMLTIAAAAMACGGEDIELTRSRAPDGGSSGEAGDFGDDARASTCDARAPSVACLALGAPCVTDATCCAGHCAAGACVYPATCGGAGATCTTPGGCCSGLCEPVAGTTTRACLAACKPAGTACSTAADCCSLGCNGGICGGAECAREGATCTANAQCCSNECSSDGGGGGSRCVLDPVATCRASGDDCHSGGSAPCCGACDESTERCDPGAGPCRATGSVCRTTADCCHGTCADSGSGELLCTSAPLANGTSCVASFECASEGCVGNPPVCGVAATTSACAVPP